MGPSHTFLGFPVPRSAGVHSSLSIGGELKCHAIPPSRVHSTSLESFGFDSSFGMHSPSGTGPYRDCSTEETQKRTPKEVIPPGEERAGVRWLRGLSDTPQAKVNPEQKQGAVDSHCPSGLGEHL